MFRILLVVQPLCVTDDFHPLWLLSRLIVVQENSLIVEHIVRGYTSNHLTVLAIVNILFQ